MTTLLQLQDQFQHFLTSGITDINASIVSTEKVSVDTRLTIYKDAYQLRLIDSLKSNFAGLRLYLGDEEFNKLGHAYLNSHPSDFRSIRWFGDKLAQFIKSNYDEEYAYIVELTDFEWKMTLAFDAADEPLLEVADMVAIAPEDWASLCFSLHPSVQRLDYFWNATLVWQALINDKTLPTWQKSDNAISWIMWRAPDYSIQYYSLARPEAWALEAIRNGYSFAQLCEGLCVWLKEEDVGMSAASYLKGWIQKGMLVKK